ncbi:preprotein translocase subunit SecA [bacterium]|nr:preprotein translocase subunit SecA [bacterium]
MSFLAKLFGDPNEKYLKKLQPVLQKINSLESKFEHLSDEELREQTEEFKLRLKKGDSLDDLLPEVFSQVREASKRTLRQRHFDVQLIGGIALHQGKIAQMLTGEGKTLAATLPAALNALEGKGVHIVTVNDYLAKRDTVWMGQIYHLLGISVGCIVHNAAYLYDPEYQEENEKLKIKNEKLQFEIQNKNSKLENNERDKERDLVGGFKVIESYLRPVSRKEAYLADITYGTNNEFGFDYLKDNMVSSLSQMVQRGFNYAIIDEVDSILIDEARTPLIISQPDFESSKMYREFARIIPRLKENIDYNIDEKMKAATLTEEGINKIERILGVENVYASKGIKYLHYLEQGLRAMVFFKRDRDYIVKDGKVIIIDEFTGRLMPGRRYSGGLHQAIEAKEGVEVKPESKTLATVTFQNYFRMYKKLAGMTGTAITSAEEFDKVYKMQVVVVPTAKPMQRNNLPDRIYKTERGKLKAVVEEIKKRHEAGQPVLVGTRSVEKNEYLGRLLEREGIKPEILNAKHHEREGEIIAQAGRLGKVTVATNMAGRGVDIVLGGNPPSLEEAEKVKKLGGLHVIGTERHEARRIDDQLRGRAGRQGDPGSSQFFVSLEDDLLRIFGGDRIKSLMETLRVPEDMPIESKLLSRAIEKAQERVEGMNFDLRKHILEFDDVLLKHRDVLYKKRREVLEQSEKGELRLQILDIVAREIKKVVNFHCGSPEVENWNIEELFEEIKTIFPLPDEFHLRLKDISKKDLTVESRREEIIKLLCDLSRKVYELKEKEEGVENMRQLEKSICLSNIDFLWRDHLENMEYLRDSVNLRAYGGRDPLVEYKTEGHRMFKKLLSQLDENIARTIFKLTIRR